MGRRVDPISIFSWKGSPDGIDDSGSPPVGAVIGMPVGSTIDEMGETVDIAVYFANIVGNLGPVVNIWTACGIFADQSY